jgi:hypothetical protein
MALLAFVYLPNGLGRLVAALGIVVALVGVVLVSAALLVLLRSRRAASGRRDLFLELNRSREPHAIQTAAPKEVTRLRRWLARQLLGHDLVAGDLVEVKSWDEIHATLDEEGRLEHLPFMPEMLAMCGRRARVFRCAHRIFDYRKSRRMRHMSGAVLLVGVVCNGSAHGACDAACVIVWKAAWVRRLESPVNAADPGMIGPEVDATILQPGTVAPRYACQLTQLHAASQPVGDWSLVNFVRPLISGNVTLAAFIVGWLTHLFNEVQHLRQGVGFPVFGPSNASAGADAQAALQPGNEVIVRSPAEIRSTLNERLEHRGMGFEPDMLKHCGRRYCVGSEVRRVIDIVTGEMRTMKTPAYILKDVHFSGERQLFNAQWEPLFWRADWLRKVEDRPRAPGMSAGGIPDVS